MSFPVSIYRYGTSRPAGEGMRIGVTRFIPRGVRREDRQKLNYFDVWLPLLAPEAELVSAFQAEKMTFARFASRYRSAMKAREPQQVIELLAGMSFFQPIALGCFCEDESRCHRSLLQKLVVAEVKARRSGFAKIFETEEGVARYASPVCFAHLEET